MSHLQQVAIKSKVGSVSRVKNVPVKVVSSTSDKYISMLYQYKKSPMAWFRLPFAELVCFSCDDYDDFKRNFRLQLRAMADVDSRLPTDPIPIFVYVQPTHLEDSRGPLRVVDAATKELSDKNFPGSMVVHVAKNMFGIQDLIESIRAALFVSMEARSTAYHNEASKIISTVVEPKVSTNAGNCLWELYLVKDSAAALFESAGMYQDAWMEYSEMEAMIEDKFARLTSSLSKLDQDNDLSICHSITIAQAQQNCSEASQMWHSWQRHRSLVSYLSIGSQATIREIRTYIDLVLMPSIVSHMVRILMKDSKRMEALEMCKRFIDKHRFILQKYETNHQCPAYMTAVWTFAACIDTILLFFLQDNAIVQGNLYFSKDLEEADSDLAREVGYDCLIAAHKTATGIERPGSSPSFYCSAGQLLMTARDMLARLGQIHGWEPPSFYPSAKELLNLLQKGCLKHVPKTPQFSGSRSMLTPQNSLGAEDSPRFGALSSHSHEFLKVAHERALTMDNIDLSVVEKTEEKLRTEESEDNDLSGRKISIHAREMSDSGNIIDAAAAPHKGHGSDGQTPLIRTYEQVPADSLSALEIESSINNSNKQCRDLYFQILSNGSPPGIQKPEQNWQPQYWRLRHIVKSSTAFDNMWKSITRTCKELFEKGDYFRNACILSIEYGDAIYMGGDYSMSAQIYDRALREFQEQPWERLLESIMLKLACAQIQSNDIEIMQTCNRILQAVSKQKDRSAALKVKEYANIFLTASNLSALPNPSEHQVESECLTLNPSMSLSIDHSIGMVIYEIDGALSFAGESQQCLKAHVGDSVNVTIQIINNMGSQVKLDNASICLVALQEMNNIERSPMLGNVSPSPMTPNIFNNSLHSPMFSPRSPNDEGWKPRIVSHWQDIDEVQGAYAANSPIDLTPGVNNVQFRVNPIRPGLYKLKSVKGIINSANVQFFPAVEEHVTAGQRIILKVEPPAPRLFVKATTIGNKSLISGEKQWLGLEICLAREALTKAQLNVEWPSRTDIHSERSNIRAIKDDCIIYPIHAQAIVKNLILENETLFASPERNSDILGSGPSSTYSLELQKSSKLHVLVWWRVSVKQSEAVVEDVRIHSCQHRIRDASPSKCQNALAMRETKQGLTFMDMPISLHFADHYSRTLSSCASLSVDQPFQVQTEAHETKKGKFVVSLKITSSIERRILVKRVSLACQDGFLLQKKDDDLLHIFPSVLMPMSSLYVSFMMELKDGLLQNRAAAQSMVYRAGKQSPSEVLVEYEVEEESNHDSMLETYIMDDGQMLENASALYSVYDQSFGPTHNDYQQILSGNANAESDSVYTHQHKIAFQLSSIDTDSYNVFVSVRMLGPFTAIIGCPVTLCWQLERVGSGSDAPECSSISYEILADKNCWSRGSRGQGRISLGLQSGSVATIEAQWTPTSLGTFEVPTLRLHDVYYQEIRETGVKKNLIIVKS